MAQRGPRYQAMKIQDVTEMLWDLEFRMRRIEAETLESHQAQFQELHHLRNENHWLKNMLSLMISKNPNPNVDSSSRGHTAQSPTGYQPYELFPTDNSTATDSFFHRQPGQLPLPLPSPQSQVAGPSSMTPNITPACFHQPTSQQVAAPSSMAQLPTDSQVAGPSSMTPNITPASSISLSQQYISTSSTSAGINTSSTSAGISTSSTSAGTCEEQ